MKNTTSITIATEHAHINKYDKATEVVTVGSGDLYSQLAGFWRAQASSYAVANALSAHRKVALAPVELGADGKVASLVGNTPWKKAFGVQRVSDGKLIPTAVGEQFSPPEQARLFGALGNSALNDIASLTSYRVTEDGASHTITMRLGSTAALVNGQIQQVGDRVVDIMLRFGYNGTGSIRGHIRMMEMVCANTMMRCAKKAVVAQAKNTKNGTANAVSQIHINTETIVEAITEAEHQVVEYNNLVLPQAIWDDVVWPLVGAKNEDAATKPKKDAANTLTRLYQGAAKGASQRRANSLFALQQAITEYYDHHASERIRDTTDLFESKYFGTLSKQKEQSLLVLDTLAARMRKDKAACVATKGVDLAAAGMDVDILSA